MANAEHLALLQQGTAIWNDWRKTHPNTLPDLKDPDLSKAKLSGAKLFEAVLNGVRLTEADLWPPDTSLQGFRRSKRFLLPCGHTVLRR